MAQSEIDQLKDKRDKLASDLEDLDAQILDLKKKRYAELQAEMESLGMHSVPSPATLGKKKGRQRGFKMSDDHKAKLAAGRAKAKAARTGEEAKLPIQ